MIALPARRALAHEAQLRLLQAHESVEAAVSRLARDRRGVSMALVGEDRTGRDHPTDRPPTGRRFTVSEAAVVLDITVEAVRGRIKRGTIGHERDGERVYVLLDADQAATGRDQDDDQGTCRPAGPLVELLRDQVEDLRNDRDAWREQARRSDYLLGSSMERTRELESRLRELDAGQPPAGSEEPRESDVSPGLGPTPTDPGDAQETPAQRVPWGRRVFGP